MFCVFIVMFQGGGGKQIKKPWVQGNSPGLLINLVSSNFLKWEEKRRGIQDVDTSLVLCFWLQLTFHLLVVWRNGCSVQFSSVTQSSLTLCDPINTACQASLSITNSQSLPKPMSIESVMPSNHLILCHPLLLLPSIFPSIPGSFQMSQFFTSGGQSIRVSASASVLQMNTQDWSPLGWTGWISLQSKGLSRVFFNTTVQKHQFFGVQLSL